MQKLLNTLEAGQVLRYHSAPSVPCQSLAEHQWNVAMIAHYLLSCVPHTSVETWCSILLGALVHDNVELYTGDIPSPAKWDSPVLEEELWKLEREHEKKVYSYVDAGVSTSGSYSLRKYIIKLADHLEGYRWCKLNERGDIVTKRWEDSLVRRHAEMVGNPLVPAPLVDAWVGLFVSFGGSLTLLPPSRTEDTSEPSGGYINQD